MKKLTFFITVLFFCNSFAFANSDLAQHLRDLRTSASFGGEEAQSQIDTSELEIEYVNQELELELISTSDLDHHRDSADIKAINTDWDELHQIRMDARN